MTDIEIIDYVKAACNLYGVIHLRNLIKIIKHYESVTFTRAQLENFMLNHITHNTIVHYKNGFLYQSDVFKSIEDAIKLYKKQKNKPYYLPQKKEFLRYINTMYFEKTKEYMKMRGFLCERAKEEYYKNLGIDKYMDIVMQNVIFAIQNNHNMNNIMESLFEFNININDNIELKEFGDLFMNLMNHTRMIYNHGFTPTELKNQMTKGFMN